MKSLLRTVSRGAICGTFEVDEDFVKKHASLTPEEVVMVQKFIQQSAAPDESSKAGKKAKRGRSKLDLAEQFEDTYLQEVFYRVSDDPFRRVSGRVSNSLRPPL